MDARACICMAYVFGRKLTHSLRRKRIRHACMNAFTAAGAQMHARTHTCTCIRYERMETLHICDPLCGRLAGFSVGVGVHREHRRVEHRGRDVNVLCKRLFCRSMQCGEVMPSVGLLMVIYTRRD